MLKQRIIGAITILDGWAVQSMGYKRYLPLGRPEVIAKNLDRWGADEILVQCINRSKENAGPDFKVLSQIANEGITTPLIYAGGIKNHQQAIKVIRNGADRIMFDALMHDSHDVINNTSKILGPQALIGCIPISIDRGNCYRFNYLTNKKIKITTKELQNIYAVNISELLLVDYTHEGFDKGFDLKILSSDIVKNSPLPLLFFGGISNPKIAEKVLQDKKTAAIAIGNFLSYRENSIEYFKRTINNALLRSHRFK